MAVPKWNEHYPSLSDANKAQKRFYEELEKGLNEHWKTDVDGNISYIFVYLYKKIEGYLKDRDAAKLLNSLLTVRELYGYDSKISAYTNHWIVDVYLSKEDYEAAWQTLIQCEIHISFIDLIQLRRNCKDTSLTAGVIFKVPKSYTGITKYGEDNFNEMLQLVDVFLTDFVVEKGINHLAYFLDKFDYGNLTEEDFNELQSFYTNSKDFFFEKKLYEDDQQSNRPPYPKKYHHYLFSGAPIEDFESRIYLVQENIPYIIQVALEKELKRVIKEAEHTIRAEKHLPNLSGWWASEAELFYKLANHYKNEQIVHHGKPDWIKRQHLDIYFPKKNIAVEYQDIQCTKESFNDIESFTTQRKQILKKQKLCEQNNCALIYVYKGYDFEEVISLIDSALYKG